MPEAVVGFAAVFAFFAIIVKVTILVYFFVLMNRILKTVERIDQRCDSIDQAVRAWNKPEN